MCFTHSQSTWCAEEEHQREEPQSWQPALTLPGAAGKQGKGSSSPALHLHPLTYKIYFGGQFPALKIK